MIPAQSGFNDWIVGSGTPVGKGYGRLARFRERSGRPYNPPLAA
jgi:hypothetical protein